MTKRIEDGAIGVGIVRAVRMRMVSEPVHVLAQNLRNFVTQHLSTRAIDEYAMSVKINTENPFASGLQQQPELVWPGECLRTAHRLHCGRDFGGERVHASNFSKDAPIL